MTGTGDGLNHGFLSEPELQQKRATQPVQAEEAFDGPSPLGRMDSLPDSPGQPDTGHDEDEDGGSVFDDDSPAPIDSIDEIPDAIPNISDGGTEILSHGRVELQEFSENFSPAGSSESLDSERKPLDGNRDQAGSAAPLDMLGGLLVDELEDVAESPTVIIEGRQERAPGSEPASEDATRSATFLPELESTAEEFPASSEFELEVASPGSALDIINDEEDLSLSGITSSVDDCASVASPVPQSNPGSVSGGNRGLLFALGGYAIVVTALCVLLLSLLARARNASRLESLPDLPPEPAKQMTIVPVNAELPPGHTLSLGESQQFGHLRVEPLRVTRGPLQFVYSGDKRDEGFKTDPVLMLWMKFTNASSDQAFIPLDPTLLFRRSRDGERSNNFVMEKSKKPQGTPCVMIHQDDLLKNGEWTLSGQHLGQTLQPGESLETYIPTVEEGIDRLAGDLLWRVQLRKGQSPSGNGVTTLIEVVFPADQIQSDGT